MTAFLPVAAEQLLNQAAISAVSSQINPLVDAQALASRIRGGAYSSWLPCMVMQGMCCSR